MGDPFDGFDELQAPTDKWTIEGYDPERDDPPKDHHEQPDDDPPDSEDE